MSEEHAASNKTGNEKLYLGIIVVLVVVILYQFINRPAAKPKLPPPPPPVVKTTKPPAPPESTPVVEGWGQFPMTDILKQKQWLSDNNVKLIILLDNKLQARVADKDGVEAKVCARPVDGGTGRTGECATIKAATVTRATSIFVEIRENSPGDCWINIGGILTKAPWC